MKDFLIKLSVKWEILKDENGQDLIEYALVVALVAMGATVSMGTVATDVSHVFTTVGTKITSATT